MSEESCFETLANESEKVGHRRRLGNPPSTGRTIRRGLGAMAWAGLCELPRLPGRVVAAVRSGTARQQLLCSAVLLPVGWLVSLAGVVLGVYFLARDASMDDVPVSHVWAPERLMTDVAVLVIWLVVGVLLGYLLRLPVSIAGVVLAAKSIRKSQRGRVVAGALLAMHGGALLIGGAIAAAIGLGVLLAAI